MRKMLTWVAATLMLATPSLAQDNPVLVELYTSQGCSSCPPADAFLHELAKRDDVVALALHVDYWDYIGWKDVFGNPAHSARQRSYAKVGGRKMIYTPQMVINGEEHVVGNRPRDVEDVIAKHQSTTPSITLTAERRGDELVIKADTAEALNDNLTVQVVRYMPNSTVDIRRGENAGKVLSYANVVTELRAIGDWDTQAPLEMNTGVEGDQPIVVLLQHQGQGPIAAVARIN